IFFLLLNKRRKRSILYLVFLNHFINLSIFTTTKINIFFTLNILLSLNNKDIYSHFTSLIFLLNKNRIITLSPSSVLITRNCGDNKVANTAHNSGLINPSMVVKCNNNLPIKKRTAKQTNCTIKTLFCLLIGLKFSFFTSFVNVVSHQARFDFPVKQFNSTRSF